MNCNIDTYTDTTEYLDHGHFNIKCTYCYARYNKHESKPKYTKCCSNGKIPSKLPLYMNSLMCGDKEHKEHCLCMSCGMCTYFTMCYPVIIKFGVLIRLLMLLSC